VDVRVVTATHRDLTEMVARGEFRSDLYSRLNVFPLLLPQLRNRREDIEPLVRHFVELSGRKIGKRIDEIPEATSGQRELSPEEKLREQAFQREQEAILSPTLVKTVDFRTAAGEIATSPESEMASQLGALVQATKDHGSDGIGALANELGIRSGTRPVDCEQQNDQGQKEKFLDKVRAREVDDYLRSTRTAPLGKYEIKAGWDIPGVLEQAMNSDLPGEVKALVRSNVYDTASGKYLLIPQGSRLLGTYNSHVTYGQKGLQVIWTRITAV
jgi:type IV secretion system protein VirB10